MGGLSRNRKLPWGVLSWSRAVSDYWKGKHYNSHTEAFNAALREFGSGSYLMDYYFDCASFADYRKLVLNV